jgi:hypothetical protein
MRDPMRDANAILSEIQSLRADAYAGRLTVPQYLDAVRERNAELLAMREDGKKRPASSIRG